VRGSLLAAITLFALAVAACGYADPYATSGPVANESAPPVASPSPSPGADDFNSGAGLPVAKHGNYGVSSLSGSSNILEYFGYKFTNNKDELKRCLDRANICFMHAPLFHPAMKNVAPIRKELGVKTFFNMLGPMINPAFVCSCQAWTHPTLDLNTGAR